ncbi:MAG: hypothetical protein CM1200mP41_33050 [Gammaproteobacteria bacterium]|nr:MAG: hypothetical protein CM1200mP41_33050 [Gammaproteobacteria bacterium]
MFGVLRPRYGAGFHEEPQVLHYGIAGTGLELQSGMTLTIKPHDNAGQYPTRLLPDGWTVVTRDHSLSAQWEHTIAVTDSGYEVLRLLRGKVFERVSRFRVADSIAELSGNVKSDAGTLRRILKAGRHN